MNALRILAAEGDQVGQGLVVDRATLDGFRQMDPEFLESLIASFLEEAPRNLAAMREACEHGDAREVGRQAHTLKGSAAVFGAAALTEMCRNFEGRETLPEPGALDGLDAAFARVRVALEEMLQTSAEVKR